MEPVAGLLDGLPGDACGATLRMQQAQVTNPELTPLARVLVEMRASREGVQDYPRRLGEACGCHWRARILHPQREAESLWRVEESKRHPTEIEAADDVDFDTFLLTPPRGCERIRYLLPRAASWMLLPAFSIC
jgi:gamma-glutamylcysteine synthetase